MFLLGQKSCNALGAGAGAVESEGGASGNIMELYIKQMEREGKASLKSRRSCSKHKEELQYTEGGRRKQKDEFQ